MPRKTSNISIIPYHSKDQHLAPPPDCFQDIGPRCVCHNLRRASRAVTRVYDRHLAPSGLRATQFSILAAASARGPLTMGSLAAVLATERTTLTRNLALLEERGLVRQDSGQDRRERVVAITEQGLAAIQAARPFWEEAQQALEQALGADRLAQALETLASLAGAGLAGMDRAEAGTGQTGPDA